MDFHEFPGRFCSQLCSARVGFSCEARDLRQELEAMGISTAGRVDKELGTEAQHDHGKYGKI